MAKEKPKTVVPKLRFPEFRNAPEWNLEQGDDLFDAINTRAPSEPLPILAITQEFGAIPRDQIDYHVSVTEQSLESYKVVEDGDFIISLRSFQGGIEYSNYRGICSPAYVILRRKGKGLDGYFRHLFKTPRYIQQLTRNIEGLRDGKMISYKQFSEQLIPAPLPGEQKRIADCLTSFDELIAAQEQKFEALKTYKRGLMQQLFPLEGERSPKLRFPEFRRRSAWDLVRGDKVFGVINRRAQSDPLPVLAITQEHGAIPRDQIDYFVSVSPQSLETYKVVEVGDFIISLRSFQGGIEYSNYRGMCSPVYVILRRKGNGVDGFFRHLFKTPRFIQQLTRNIEGLRDGKMISYKQFSEQLIPTPLPDEQKKISDYLTSFDELIAAQEHKVHALKTYKRSLMQQLFPSMAEDTA